MSEELSPSPEELRRTHAEHAASVKFLGDLATSRGETTHVNDDEAVHDSHKLVPGYRTKLDGEYDTSAPSGARAHLEKAKADAQAMLDESDAQASEVVSENLDKFIHTAKVDMTKDVLEQHRENAALYHNYAKGSELEGGYRANMEEYAQRHSDVLDPTTAQRIEQETIRRDAA